MLSDDIDGMEALMGKTTRIYEYQARPALTVAIEQAQWMGGGCDVVLDSLHRVEDFHVPPAERKRLAAALDPEAASLRAQLAEATARAERLERERDELQGAHDVWEGRAERPLLGHGSHEPPAAPPQPAPGLNGEVEMHWSDWTGDRVEFFDALSTAIAYARDHESWLDGLIPPVQGGPRLTPAEQRERLMERLRQEGRREVVSAIGQAWTCPEPAASVASIVDAVLVVTEWATEAREEAESRARDEGRREGLRQAAARFDDLAASRPQGSRWEGGPLHGASMFNVDSYAARRLLAWADEPAPASPKAAPTNDPESPDGSAHVVGGWEALYGPDTRPPAYHEARARAERLVPEAAPVDLTQARAAAHADARAFAAAASLQGELGAEPFSPLPGPAFAHTDEYGDTLVVRRFPECWSFYVDPDDDDEGSTVGVKVPHNRAADLARVLAAATPTAPNGPEPGEVERLRAVLTDIDRTADAWMQGPGGAEQAMTRVVDALRRWDGKRPAAAPQGGDAEPPRVSTGAGELLYEALRQFPTYEPADWPPVWDELPESVRVALDDAMVAIGRAASPLPNGGPEDEGGDVVLVLLFSELR